MMLVTLIVAVVSMLVAAFSLMGALSMYRSLTKLEERVAWLEGRGVEATTEPEPDVLDIMKVGATQPPGDA